ncbi:hypothetical protein [Colwellia sp. MEBiC06753]
MIDNSQIAILFSEAYLVAETPFSLYVETQSPEITIASGYMEGVDMFMGKIPLFFKEEPEITDSGRRFTSQGLFGACSQKNMTWRVWLNLTIEKQGNVVSKTVFLDVKSYQSAADITTS